MNKSVLVILMFVSVLIISGCAGSQLPTETPPPNPTSVPTSPPTNTPKPTRPVRPVINIPMGTTPTINGRIEEGEWDVASQQELNDGTLLYLMYAEDSLYLAVDSEVLGTVNVGVLRDEELWVLHSSAALGSLVYEPQDDGWKLRKTFKWCCRARSDNFDFGKLLTDEGWLSTNQFQGDETQTEYLIQIPEEEIILSVTYRYQDDSGAAYWPDTLAENDLLKFTTTPQIGDEPFFSSDMWVRLMVSE